MPLRIELIEKELHFKKYGVEVHGFKRLIMNL